MQLQLRWVQDDERDRVAVARMRSYAAGAKDLLSFQERTRLDPRAVAGDFLLAEAGGEPVGTATSLSLTMWLRGASVWCQGVAWVGTVRTHRRGGTNDQPGIATLLMAETIRKGRERGQAVSALMPFRNSFYERFGYGLIERRNEWTIPLPLLPKGDFDGLRFVRSGDVEAIAVCRQKMVCRGQGDIKRTRQTWDYFLKRGEDGFFIVDRPDANGPVRGYCGFGDEPLNGKARLRVTELGYEDPAALRRILHFLAGQKDQYSTATLVLPADLPLNRILRETQLPMKPPSHAIAECRPLTRMQLKVLDHKAMLEAIVLPPTTRGRAVVAVHEVEGTITKFQVEADDGRVTVTPSEQSPQYECPDTTWAGVACGDLSATRAAELGLATCTTPACLLVLDAFAAGPSPFCNEPF